MRPESTSERFCETCRTVKPLDEFQRNGARGHVGRCKDCRIARLKTWRTTYQHKQAMYRRAATLAKFSLTTEEYDAMMVAQAGVCGMCGETCSTGRRLAVDHDHRSGRVRALLCQRCNRALGQYEAIQKAAERYLAAYGTGNPHISHGEAFRARTRERPRGTAVHNSRLDEETVRQIRARHAQGSISQRALAREYGVSLHTVGKVVRRESWQHVPDAA